ncbi:RNA polymerase sigma factor [Desulforegula conservatrix]|uniref:RNA polymerase sigma factor n=1 Tax=Desulforegula conservatrix TaxID=153026 RepID=UPI00041854B1|nr:sigma-70 family RNA polymerase sigma factor [Desulforegula conservatrix]
MEKPAKHPKLQTDEDAVLIKNINDGSPHLMESLVGKYSRRLYNFGLKICRNPADAEDLVQDTFINMIRYMKYFRYETKFKNWLYRVAVTACIRMRKKSKFAPDKEISLDDADFKDELEAQSCGSLTEEPIDRLISLESEQIVKNAIQALPPQYRLILVLRDMEGFSVEETSKITGLSQSNVKVRLHRARHQVREKLMNHSSFDDNRS